MELKVCPSAAVVKVGVAEVLANWQNVFRAINLATGMHKNALRWLETDGSEIRRIGRRG